MIVGTAGHIDHGKTSLVKALTGVDTDRLKEEKARGISIELGYAYLPLRDGQVLGFVDVPGHERFVDHMVAGATGIDYVLLVIAADDGPMPQTLEHLDIVELLGVRRGAIAMSKIDRVDDARRAECRAQICALLASTSLAGAPMFDVSSATGEGLAELKEHLAHEAAAFEGRRSTGAAFRLAVDRSFTLDGVGTVVTGTVASGEVRVGDEVAVTPSGRIARVRSLHAQNRTSTAGRCGERCALALAGLAKEEVARGEWIVAPRLHAPTSRFEARLRLSARESRALAHWSPVHLHLGTEHVLARVALLEGETLPPGRDALAQIVSERPIGALSGDAFVIRDASASRTIGGGRVIEPAGRERHRRAPERIEVLRRFECEDPLERLRRALEVSPDGVDLAAFAIAHNTLIDERQLGDAVRVVSGSLDFALSRSSWMRIRERLLAMLAEYHDRHPDELGPDLGRVRRMEFPRHDIALVEEAATSLLGEGKLSRNGPWWHLPSHSLKLTAQEEALAQRVLPRLEDERFDPAWARDLAHDLGAPENEMRALLRRLARRGEVFAIVKDLYFSRSAVAELAEIARSLEDECGAVRVAEFRDRAGIGRKRAVQVLEFFDRVGFTRRARDDHRIRADNLLKLERKGLAPGGAAGLQTR
ncbi:MAG TPA: selenocysteine-specific translation elongation factor [Usitatibacter sp.]|nr:selenocysteine-specific translation elongation factor [Usitatibacter sp.]